MRCRATHVIGNELRSVCSRFDEEDPSSETSLDVRA